MYLTGIRGVLMAPGTQWPNSLSGILFFGLLFILPVAAIVSRIYYRKYTAFPAGRERPY
jgi:hypothetical protein